MNNCLSIILLFFYGIAKVFKVLNDLKLPNAVAGIRVGDRELSFYVVSCYFYNNYLFRSEKY